MSQVAERWKYEGAGGTKFPVQKGEVWRAGPHLLACIDLLVDFNRFRQKWAAQPKMLYSDPPWNDSNVSSFYTKAGRTKGTSHAELLKGVCDIAASMRVPAWLEGSSLNVQVVKRAVEATGGRMLHAFNVTYYKKNPSMLFQVSWGPDFAAPDVEGRDDADTPLICLHHAVSTGLLSRGDTVLDTCTGLSGLTAQAASKCGLNFVGSELSPYRMSGALSCLEALGHEVSLVGFL